MVNLLVPIFKIFPSRGLRFVPIRPIGSPAMSMRHGRVALGSSQTERKLRVSAFRNTNQISS